MRIFRIEHGGLIRFMRAFHLLTTIGEIAHLEFYCFDLKLVVVSYHLLVTLHIRPPLLLHYYLPPHSLRYFKIHLKELYNLLSNKIDTSSWVDFNLDHRQPPLATLKFQNDGSEARLTRIRKMSTPLDVGDFSEVTGTKFVSIDSEKLKQIVMEFINFDRVGVVLTNSHVMFSSEFGGITFNVKNKECIIGGIDVGERIEYSIKLRPTKFFSDLASWIERVWFYHETTKTNIVISAPIGFESLFTITLLD